MIRSKISRAYLTTIPEAVRQDLDLHVGDFLVYEPLRDRKAALIRKDSETGGVDAPATVPVPPSATVPTPTSTFETETQNRLTQDPEKKHHLHRPRWHRPHLHLRIPRIRAQLLPLPAALVSPIELFARAPILLLNPLLLLNSTTTGPTVDWLIVSTAPALLVWSLVWIIMIHRYDGRISRQTAQIGELQNRIEDYEIVVKALRTRKPVEITSP